MGRLEGKIAIVTGAAGGIGRATAERFVAEGARVLLVDRDPSVMQAAGALPGDRASGFTADTSREEDVRAYVAACVERFGGLDVLVANAGIEGVVRPLVEQTVEDFDRVLAVNVRGVWLGIKHAAPHIAARGGGAIVATSSVAGLVGSPGLGAYVASKHAVIGLAKTAALELASRGIRVNTLNPGPIENRMMRSVEAQVAPEDPGQVRAQFLGMVPLGRYGTNEEMAEVALFLASDASSYCTGAVFVADGGMIAS